MAVTATLRMRNELAGLAARAPGRRMTQLMRQKKSSLKQRGLLLLDWSDKFRALVPDVAHLLVDRPEPQHVLRRRTQQRRGIAIGFAKPDRPVSSVR